MQLDGLDHVGLSVAEVRRSVEWYEDPDGYVVEITTYELAV